MRNKMITKGIMIFLVVLFLVSGLTSMCFAAENVNKYEVVKSEENIFLQNIYKNETETKKIKTINKNISNKNYMNKEIFETKTLKSNDLEYIYQEFGKNQEFNDNEYKGTLPITDVKIETINNGYYEKIDEKILKFNGYSDNDLINIEKEITLNNKKYYLINVEWEADTIQNIDGTEIPNSYKGNKIYQTIEKISNPNTYNVTVEYSGQIEKIDTIYDYEILYENIVKEETKKEDNTNIVPIIIVSGLGLTILLIVLLNKKNTYIYSKNDKGLKLIKKVKLSDKNVVVDITNCKNKSKENIYAIKVNLSTFNKLKGRTISIVLENKKKDIILWNSYYEIKI